MNRDTDPDTPVAHGSSPVRSGGANARTGEADASPCTTDLFVAAAIALITSGVYLLTLYPSVGGGGDAIKFQYIGRVLGTGHPPGYPLYVLVSHLFSRIPIGTPAYRINVMSASFGALASALVYLIGRRVNAGRAAAAGAALALAFGAGFWAKSVVAEVYTLNAALFAGILLALVTWSARRGPQLYAAVGLFALALGNHLTTAFTAPVLLIYALLVDWRRALRPGTVIASGAILIAGFAQYLFVLVRTRQGAPYLEATARNLRELIDVIRARRFSEEIGSFGRHELVADRLPQIASALQHELTWLGVAAAAVGLAVLARRRPRDAVLFGGAAAAVFLLTMNVGAELEGFLMPVSLALAPLVAVGLDACARVRGAALAATAAAALLPAWQVSVNYRANDHHTRTFEARYIDAFFERLADKSAIVSESYTDDQLVAYKLAAEDGAAGRDIRIVPRDVSVVHDLRARGFTIFARPDARRELERQGFQFADEPLLGDLLWQHVRELRSGWTAIVAAPPGALREWPPEALDLLPVSRDGRDQGWRTAPAVFAIVGGRHAGLARVDATEAVLDLAEGASIGGRPSPAAIHADASAARARIRIGDRVVVETAGEVAFAAIAPAGVVAEATRIDPTRHLRVPFDDPAYALARVTAAAACAEIGNRGWQDITHPFSEGRLRVRLDDYRPFEARFEAYLVAESPLAVAMLDPEAPSPPRFAVTLIPPSALREALARDGAPIDPPAGALVYRVSLEVNDLGQEATAIVETHGRVSRATARAVVDRDNPKRAIVCGLPLGEPLSLGSTLRADAARAFVQGWHGVEGEGANAFRWTSALDAEVLVPLADARPSRVVVRAMPLPGGRVESFTLVVNGNAQPAVTLRPGWNDYVFDVAPERWMTGLNEIVIRSARLVQPSAMGGADARQLGVAIRAMTLGARD